MSKGPQDDHYGRHREDGPAVEWASGTKLVLHKDGFTVYGADGGATDVRGVTKINESRQSGGRLIEYSNDISVTISDSGITVKQGDGASLHYSKDLSPTGEKVPHKPLKPFQP